jgi:hypothetical protein
MRMRNRYGMQRCGARSSVLMTVSLSLLASIVDASCPTAPNTIRPSAGAHPVGVCAREMPPPAQEIAAAHVEHPLPAHSIQAANAAELMRWEGLRMSVVVRSGFDPGRPAEADAGSESSVHRTLDDVPWADARDWVHNPPQILQELRNYRRQGMPILHLVNSAQTVVALGLSNHGKPGLYFTRKLPF